MRIVLKNQREWRALSPRVRIICDANGGLGTARPTGKIRGRARCPDRAVWADLRLANELRIRLGMVRNSVPDTTASEGLQSSVSSLQSFRAFTLVELMAVIVVICVMVGALIGVAKYANRQIGITRVKAQMALLQMALEAYKADVGYYPASTWVHYSGFGLAELSNSACLYRALTRPKCYYRPRKVDIGVTGQLTYFIDPWGTAWNYYRPALPQPTSLIVCNVSGTYNSYAWGNQHNPLTYDLYSYGPDKTTSIPNTSLGWWAFSVASTGHDADDIVNWKR